MAKYEPLTAFLESKAGREVKMSFTEIEAVIGQKLPEKSKVQRAWWSNNPSNNVMTKAWLAAGYKTGQVDVAGETLCFVPDAKVAQRAHHPAFGSMKGTAIVPPGVDLTQPADPDWGKVYDDDYHHGVAADTQNGGGRGMGESKQFGFKPDEKTRSGETAAGVEKKPYRHPAWGALKGMITIKPDVDLTEPPYEDWKTLYGEDE